MVFFKKTVKEEKKTPPTRKKAKKAKFTPKQALFCKEYLIDLNATQAAIRAGYSKKTAGKIGQENLVKPEIQKYLQKSMDKRIEKTEITAEYILKNIKEIGERCMQRVPVMVREGKRMVQKMEQNDEGEDVGVWEFREMGALKAQELLGKHQKLFTDKVEVTGKDGTSLSIDTTTMTLEEKAKAIADKLNPS